MKGKTWSSVGLDEVGVQRIIERVQNAGMKVELNTVMTAYADGQQIKSIVKMCDGAGINIKCFERVLPRPHPDNGRTILLPAPDTPLSLLTSVMQEQFGDEAASPANDAATADSLCELPNCTVRYGRLLCLANACFLTGTRVDPHGHVSVCINRLSGDRSDVKDSTEATVRKIRAAVNGGCVDTQSLIRGARS